jgi:hypothetical protein
MRNKLLIAGFMLAVALPGAALAQPDPGCVRDNQDSRAQGTILGAIGGAVLGGALAGRHDRGAGVVLGGVGGAVAGNAIAGARNDPCPTGYYRGPPPPPPGGGFWAGAPGGIHERIDFMQDRISTAASRGWISPHEQRRAQRELNFIRSEDARLRDQDGGHLRDQDRGYLQSRLDALGERLHWAEHNG